jgi:mono/diheme cytochrome c family protein
MASAPKKNPLANAAMELRDFRLPKPPFWAVSIAIVGVVASWVPLAVIAKARFSKSELPRIHLIQDMDNQPKYRPQASNTLFEDGRAMRPKIPGTVPYALITTAAATPEQMQLASERNVESDAAFFNGYTTAPAGTTRPTVQWVEAWPKGIEVNDALLARGQMKFNIYCAPCHGYDGLGNGAVHVRVEGTQTSTGWVQPANLTDEVRRGRANGHLYNTINVGIRNMNGYGSQIAPDDRWAVVAYVRALQLAQGAPANIVPPEKRSETRQQAAAQ